MPISPSGIGVGHDDIGSNGLARRQPYATRDTVVHDDLADLLVAAEPAALPFDQLDQAINQPPGAAKRKMHAPAPLQKCDPS